MAPSDKLLGYIASVVWVNALLHNQAFKLEPFWVLAYKLFGEINPFLNFKPSSGKPMSLFYLLISEANSLLVMLHSIGIPV